MYCKEDDYDKVLEVLDQGAEVNSRSKDGLTALHSVCSNSRPSLRIIQLLIERGADANIRDNRGSTALHRACCHAHTSVEVVKFLIKNGARVNEKKENCKTTALHYVCSNMENIQMVQLLLENGADVNAKTDNGLTPLIFACTRVKNIDIIKLLLDSGADVNAGDDTFEGWNPLLTIVSSNSGQSVAIARLLMDRGANTNSTKDRGMTALHFACFNRNIEMIKNLIRKGADVSATDVDGHTALDILKLRAPELIKEVNDEIMAVDRKLCKVFTKLIRDDSHGGDAGAKIISSIPEIRDVHQARLLYVYLGVAEKSGAITLQDRKLYTQHMLARTMTLRQIPSTADSSDIFLGLLEKALQDELIESVAKYIPTSNTADDDDVAGGPTIIEVP